MPTSTESQALQADLVRLRRAIHRDPELGLDLPRTRRRVLDALAGLPLELTLGQELGSVTAVLRGGRPGPAVLLRGDMDALPLAERTGLDYASRVEAMHACGHDLHTAMLVGAAHLLARRRENLSGDVIFMFQPGEEGQDGAARMIREGVLEAAGAPPIAAYAIHVMSARFPHGVLTTRPGALLAGGDLLHVTVRGKGGHGSAPHLARDTIGAAAAMITALPGLLTRTVAPQDTAVLTIGAIHAGSAGNVIPDSTEFRGTLRWHTPEIRDALRAGLSGTCRSIGHAFGVEADAHVTPYVTATVNDAAEAAFAADVATALHGPHRFEELPQPLCAGEDFSNILDHIPGAMILLGTCPPDTDPATAPDIHSPYAIFDDTILSDGASYLAELAFRRLEIAATSKTIAEQSLSHSA
ncbi:M20 metallopeptidase family protein [Nocardia macrotermitis]|uniref:Hippurate hydrolase n=1 Tax=Nocardia macrotermitis TaxID=2585198 RepID=A0A7K0D746_9NOCA|nr:M20 family metallopeptidase [Nocardia macrotermitis]MQY21381.1 Hippurate hydrolase [Nocardia macrotermitis]